MLLKQNDFYFGHELVDYIIDHVHTELIEKTISESCNKNYENFHVRREFISHLSILFSNVLLNRLSVMSNPEEAELRANEGRRVCRNLMTSIKMPLSENKVPVCKVAIPTPDELLAMNDIHINIVGATNTGKSMLMLLIGRTLHENGFKVLHFTGEGLDKNAIFENYRKAIEDLSEKTKITINEVQVNRLPILGAVDFVTRWEEFINRWKFQSMKEMGRAQLDCSVELRKDLNSLLEYALKQDRVVEENSGYIIECMSKIVDKTLFSTIEEAREYVLDMDESAYEISDEPNVFISNRSGRSSRIIKLSDYLTKNSDEGEK